MGSAFESEELLQKLRARDRATHESLVTAFTGQLYNACLGLGFDRVEADDLTQGVWLTFFDVAPQFEGRSKIRTFLFGILYNKASEYRKKRGRVELKVDIEAVVDSHFDGQGHWITGPKDPEKFLSAVQVARSISDCMELLPLTQKMAFHLKEVEGEVTSEICKILDVTATNLGVLLFRARNQLRECIERKA